VYVLPTQNQSNLEDHPFDCDLHAMPSALVDYPEGPFADLPVDLPLRIRVLELTLNGLV
jgi:hypothetical protein